jgi:hypothetical protein
MFIRNMATFFSNMSTHFFFKRKMTGQLECPRSDEKPGDDMDEVEPPLGWNELTHAEKTDILDYQMDVYWLEKRKPSSLITKWTYVKIVVCLAIVCRLPFTVLAFFF